MDWTFALFSLDFFSFSLDFHLIFKDRLPRSHFLMFFRTLFFTKRPLRLVNDYPQLWLLFLVLLIKEIYLSLVLFIILKIKSTAVETLKKDYLQRSRSENQLQACTDSCVYLC